MVVLESSQAKYIDTSIRQLLIEVIIIFLFPLNDFDFFRSEGVVALWF